MAGKRFSWQSFFIRFGFALLLVFSTYNASGYSFYHWLKEVLISSDASITPPLVLAAIVLLIAWTIYIRATLRSLGGFGLLLAFAFFAIIIWWLVDIGWLGVNSVSIFSYTTLFVLSAVLAIGMSWSHIRRRLSGQADMDDVDE